MCTICYPQFSNTKVVTGQILRLHQSFIIILAVMGDDAEGFTPAEALSLLPDGDWVAAGEELAMKGITASPEVSQSVLA